MASSTLLVTTIASCFTEVEGSAGEEHRVFPTNWLYNDCGSDSRDFVCWHSAELPGAQAGVESGDAASAREIRAMVLYLICNVVLYNSGFCVW